MRTATVETIYHCIDAIAPFDTQEEFDNTGLLIGSLQQPVRRVLIALDMTPEVIQEAKAKDVQLVVTHHPLMFHAAKRLVTDVFEGMVISEVIRAGLSLIAAHTNLDRSPLSAAAKTLERLGCSHIRAAGPYVQVGELPSAMDAVTFGRLLARHFGSGVRVFGPSDATIRCVGMAGGAYDEGWQEARSAGAQAYITGEVRHHNALAATGNGLVLYDAGHHQTEASMVGDLCNYLQREMDALQYDVEVYASESLVLAAGYTLEEEE